MAAGRTSLLVAMRSFGIAVAMILALGACQSGATVSPPPIPTASPTPTAGPTASLTASPPLIRMTEDGIVGRGDVSLVGSNPALSIGPGGLPLIVYTAATARGQAPEIVGCLDLACSRTTAVVLEVTGSQPTFAFGIDGLPLIASHDYDGVGVHVAKCGDAACAQSTVTLVASGLLGAPAVIAVGADGSLVLAYQDLNDYYVRVVKCGDASCSAGQTASKIESLVEPDGTRYLLNTIALAVPSDGRPALLIGDGGGAIRFVKCADAACSKSVAVIVDRSGNENLTATMALAQDGQPVIVEYAKGQLKVASCADPSCSKHTLSVVGTADDEFIASVAPQVALTAQGLPVIAYWEQGRVLKIARCKDFACQASDVSSYGSVNTFAFALGADGLPIIAYHDGADLKVAHCGDQSCATR